jgi:hypothetical protein
MAGREDETMSGAARVLDADEVQGVLSGSFYAPSPQSPVDEERRTRGLRKAEPKPTHYKVICISLYTKDLEHLDWIVDQLKARGVTKANRSAVIRAALEQLELDKVPRGL